MERFTQEQVEAWRRDGGVVIPGFFTPDEVAAVVADFETVYGPPPSARGALEQGDAFNPEQFTNICPVPLDCSPALNLIGVHPALVAFAKAALGTDAVHLYQCQAWAKYTGLADYSQPFHCDFMNHTLTAPSEDVRQNAVTLICYFSDVTEAHGPTHYVPKPESEPIAGPEGTLGSPAAIDALHRKLLPLSRSTAGPAGSVLAYGIDIYHRGTNLTAPGGYRYVLIVCFRRAGDDAIGFHAWPFHFHQPWANIFDHATPEQLACFGVPPPGHRFWTPATLALSQKRYPGWDMTVYREAAA